MVDHKTRPNDRRGVYFNPGQCAADIGDRAGDQPQTHTPDAMRKTMQGKRVKTRIHQKHVNPAARGGVAGDKGVGVFGETLEWAERDHLSNALSIRRADRAPHNPYQTKGMGNPAGPVNRRTVGAHDR